MTQVIYHLLNKKGGRFSIHATFLMELFVTTVRLSNGDCCCKVLPDRWGRVHGSVSEKDIVKI